MTTCICNDRTSYVASFEARGLTASVRASTPPARKVKLSSAHCITTPNRRLRSILRRKHVVTTSKIFQLEATFEVDLRKRIENLATVVMLILHAGGEHSQAVYPKVHRPLISVLQEDLGLQDR